jgi:hypothetical protein
MSRRPIPRGSRGKCPGAAKRLVERCTSGDRSATPGSGPYRAGQTPVGKTPVGIAHRAGQTPVGIAGAVERLGQSSSRARLPASQAQ